MATVTLPSSSNKLGLDKEIHERIQGKYDVALEAEAMQWIATVVGIQAPTVLGNEGAALYAWLKDGVILCDLLNALRPGTVSASRICRKPAHVLEERVSIESNASHLPTHMSVSCFTGLSLDLSLSLDLLNLNLNLHAPSFSVSSLTEAGQHRGLSGGMRDPTAPLSRSLHPQ